jgi:hypothetical protein
MYFASPHSPLLPRPVFLANRPVLCYLEGAWTNDANTTQYNHGITEPFYSVHYTLDAKSWWDLEKKSRFTAWTDKQIWSRKVFWELKVF